VKRTSTDAIFGGRVIVEQPARGRGYRVNADALILADFAGAPQHGKGLLVDLGAGVGSVALVMITRRFAKQALLVDVDDAACELAVANVMHNGADADVMCGDALDVAKKNRGVASTVVCNPPYLEPGTARVSKSSARARSGELERFVRATREILGKRGRAYYVYPATYLTRLFATLRASGLEPKRLRLVHATAEAPARVALVEARAAKAGGLAIAPPLVERHAGAYTREMRAVLGL
jgi:tRNA1Val (adenine37-N6)-methyltransferase